MPATIDPKPQTSRQAKRAYQKSNKRFQFTATQFRAAERRDLLEKRAQKTREKEQRAKENKRKREEKQEQERETKRRLVAENKISVESLWGRVRPSQPRLNSFLARPETQKQTTESVGAQKELIKGQGEDREDEDTLVDRTAQNQDSSNNLLKEEMIQITIKTDASEIYDQKHLTEQSHQQISITQPESSTQLSVLDRDHEQDLLDAQLSFSQSFWDFVIAEDGSAEPGDGRRETRDSTPVCIELLQTTPSRFKRKLSDLDSVTPSKSVRSALSEMSPSKVNVRAQEKPDTTSVKSAAKSLPSPRQEDPTPSQIADETLAMLSTQDFQEDDLITNKENKDPLNSKASPTSENKASKEYSNQVQSNTTPISARKRKLCDLEDFDNCDDLSDIDVSETPEDFEAEIDDDLFIGLSSQMAKNTAVTAQGSPRKVKLGSTQDKSMRPPPLKPKLIAVKEAAKATSSAAKSALKKADSFTFDDVDDEDLIELAEDVEMSGLPATIHKRRLILRQSSQFPISRSSTARLTANPEHENKG